ncbi:MAG: site-specific integrase [Pseudomonadota bacterium]
MVDVRKPPEAQARDRLISESEIQALIAVAGKTGSIRWRAVHAFRFAIETAMRAGENCALRPEHINGPVANLPMTKNGSSRDVPLSSRALALLAELPETDGPCFGLTNRQLDALFRQARGLAKVEGLRFHDTRHEAITRLAKKLDVLDLARMTGHRNINELLTYYNEAAKDLAAKLG